jgi:hypothetical protein
VVLTLAVIKTCSICNEEIEDIDKAMLREIKKAAMKFLGSKKDEIDNYYEN